MITEITLELVVDEWQACYKLDRLKQLFPQPRTPLEVLTLTEGPWAEVPTHDRFWTVLRSDVLPDELMRLFACWCAEQFLPLFEREHPNDLRPRNAIVVARRFACGEATGEERAAARAAAEAAAGAAARDAARDAAWAAARAAAEAAAGDAARDAAWDAQSTKLIEMVTVWVETGDMYGGEREYVTARPSEKEGEG